MKIFAKDIEVTLDESCGIICSAIIGGKERLTNNCPIFTARFRDTDGGCVLIRSDMAKKHQNSEGSIAFSGFGGALDGVTVRVFVRSGDNIEWRVSVTGIPSLYALEWIEVAKICMPRLSKNDAQGGTLLFPYNEGMLLDDETLLPRYEMEFPSSGAYFMFPNMVCSQFMAYLFNDIGFYFGAHDTKRALKGVDFYPYENGLCLQMRLYSGADFGADFEMDYPIIWETFSGDWKGACEIYRGWFEKNLPSDVVPTGENATLPKWYQDMPLIVTYPVRGIHDMDKMEPNALFPYTNALPILNKIKNDTGCKIMSLLMHWEGTAPWAPPYVWPPFGGATEFNKFRDALHAQGDLLGVYCSGFGYTLRSTLISEYDCEEQIKRDGVLEGVCHSPENKPELGITCCPYQRYGYDICPASKKGRAILDEAYSPLFSSGIDYAQILDQNHGGGQYLCYAKGHNHPPMPGEWMTSSMQALLYNWRKMADNMIFGCESASAEPFISQLLMSDCRYELNYPFGTPVPVFAYIYHEYLRNFMGNQCGCPFEPSVDTLRYRLAYSFSIGDFMTLVLQPNGRLMSHWGTHDFENAPDMDKTLTFIRNVMKFYSDCGKKYLYSGKMKNAPEIECEKIDIPMFRGRKSVRLPRLLSSAWHDGDKTAYIVINPDDVSVKFTIEGQEYEIEALSAMTVLK